jgi:hypothetical protein
VRRRRAASALLEAARARLIAAFQNRVMDGAQYANAATS